MNGHSIPASTEGQPQISLDGCTAVFASVPETPGPGNTGVSTPGHESEKAPTFASSVGVDWLGLSICARWQPDDWKCLDRDLTELKGQYEAEDLVGTPTLDVGMVNGRECGILVDRGGASRGECYFRFKLRTPGMTILLRSGHSSGFPNVFIDITSELLMQFGHLRCRIIAETILTRLGAVIERATVNRIDLRADVPIATHSFVEADHEGRQVARTREGALRFRDTKAGKEWTGIERGRSDFCLCLYNKHHELETRENPLKSAILAQAFGGEVPEDLTRVEFRATGDGLRKCFGGAELDHVFNVLGNLARWFCREWYRQTTGYLDRHNTHLSRNSEEWDVVCDAFEQFFLPPIVIELAEKPPNPEAGPKIGIGVFKNWMARMRVLGAENWSDLGGWFARFVVTYGGGDFEAFMRDVKARRGEFATPLYQFG